MGSLTTEQRKARFDRLPKWAQEEMGQSARRLIEAREELRSLLRPATDADELTFDSWNYEDKGLPTDVALPRGKVTVNLGTDEHGRKHELDIRVETDYHGYKCVHIAATYGPLRVTPTASNVVTLTSQRHPSED